MLAAAAAVVVGSALLVLFVARGAQAGVPLSLALLSILPLLSIVLTTRALWRATTIAPHPTAPHLRAHGPLEAGQTIILLTLLLPGLFGFLILVVLAGQLVTDRRDLQSDVDRAALAAALDLPNAAVAIASGYEWLERNAVDTTDPEVTVTITTPYQGNPNRVYVHVERPIRSSLNFGVIPSVTASAVAEKVSGDGGNYAIFATEDSCGASDPLQLSGSVNIFGGAVHSNSKIKINGSKNDFDGDVTSQCTIQVSGSNNTFNPDWEDINSVLPAPLDLDYSDFVCDIEVDGDIDLKSDDAYWNDPSIRTQLKTGTYCATGKLQLSGSDITGYATLVAKGELQVSGSDFDLHPDPTIAAASDPQDDTRGILLFSYANSPSAMDISGSGGEWEGIIHAPRGTAKMQGSSNLTVTGSIIAEKVQVSGSDFTMQASVDGGSNVDYIYLVE